MALLMGLAEQSTLGERFDAVREYLKKTCPHWKLGSSYSGWVTALEQELPRLLPLVVGKLREHMGELTAYQNVGRWNAIGVDGSDAACPRTQDNQAASSDKGQHGGMPLLSMTVMYHLRLGLPWALRVGSSTESERSHLEQMIDELPPNSLIVADAGFPGYACCRNMIEKQRHFVLRVGGNMHLLKDLGYEREEDDTFVYMWPNEQQERKQPPLKLRLIVIHDEVKQPIFLVTSILDPNQLTQDEGREIYYARWGVEVCHPEYPSSLLLYRLAA
jgi:hypothetical protein